MVFSVEVSTNALEDAHNALSWMEQHSPTHAAEWYAGLLDAIFSLEEMPRRCGLAPENEGADEEIRHLLYKRRTVTYRILFSIRQTNVEDESIVHIHHIRHGAQRPMTPQEMRLNKE